MTIAFSSNVKTARPTQVSWLRRNVRVLAGMMTAISHRWLAKDLCDLSDHELADIGLSRNDLDRAFELPFGADPSRYLNDVARTSSMRTIPVASGTIWSRDYPPSIRGRIE